MDGYTRESLKPLLDLQRVDSGVDRLTARRANLPEQKELDELAVERAEAVAAHDERDAVFDDVKKQQAKLEGEVSMLEEKIAHEQGRLYSGDISNPKELSNIQAELDALRRRKTHVEDQLLDVLEQRETIEAEVGELAARLAELDAKIADATRRRDEAGVEIEHELTALRAEREQYVPLLPGEVLEMYEDLRPRKNGVAAAALEEGVCRGCNVALSPLARDEIRRSDDPIIRCENCRRILVIP